MKLLNIIQLYKIVKSNNSGDLKEYSKSMSPNEVKGLRISNPFIFRLLRFIITFLVRNKNHNLGNTFPTPKKLLVNPIYTNELLEFNKKVLETIPEWNVLTLDNVTDKTFITLDKKNNKFDGLEDALQWNCYLATAIKRISNIDTNTSKLYRKIYLDMIKGIDLCLDINKKSIVRHPLKSIKKDLEPISQDMISGLVLLISNFNNTNDIIIEDVEYNIKRKFNYIMDYHDYCLMYPDGRTNSYDLKPSYIYNHIKSFAYSSIRMTQGKFDKKDAMILRDMIQTLIPEEKPPYNRSWYGLVVAVNFIDAMLELYPTDDENVNKIMDKNDFIHLAIDWLTFYKQSTPEIHPELESVLHRCYDVIGHKDGKKETNKNLLSILNLYLKFNLVEKTNDNHVVVDGYDRTYALPPHYRRPADYYWQRSAWNTGKDSEIHPSFEYTPILARILPFNYYPED